MANAYSTPINYGQTIPTTDLAQYLGTIQHGMQQKFDVNLAKIDDLISKVSSVPLIRDEDKRYLGEKLQNLLSVVDANSKIDLTDNVVARQISSQIASAIDGNVRQQLINSQVINNYEKTASQRRKDKPELYSDANYAYGLDKAGYQDYISGKTDTIGNMNYVDYYDVTSNFNKKLEDFTKERGFERVIDSSVEGGYVYKTVKGKVLSSEEVSNFFENTLKSDPKLKQQFMINAHYNARGISDEDLIKSYKDQSDVILKDYDTEISSIDSKLKNTNPDDKATTDLLHRKKSEAQTKKTNFTSQLDIKNFNRDSFIYNQYANDLKKSYINTYSYAETTDIKYDDFLSDLDKSKKKGEALSGADLAAGSAFQRGESEVEKKEEQNYLNDFDTKRKTTWGEFGAIAKSRLIAEGKQPTAANIAEYYKGLKAASKEGYDLNAQGYDAEVRNSYKKVENLNRTAYQLTKVAKEYYSTATNDILTGLWGGKSKDLNTSGLSSTLPYTMSLLKKYKSPEQISPKERAKASYEIAQNLKDYVLEEGDSKTIGFYMDSLKKDNNLSDKDVSKISTIKSNASVWGGVAKSVAKDIFYPIKNIASGVFLGPFQREEAYKQSNEEADVKRKELEKERGAAWSNLYDKVGSYLTTDASLGDVQSGDIKLGKYEGVRDRISKVQESVNQRFDKILSGQKDNLKKDYSIVLNPQIEKDKPYISAIHSAIVAEGGNPEKDSFVSIKKIEAGYATVSFTSEDQVETVSGGTKKRVEPGKEMVIPVKNLPQALVKNLQTSLSDWSFSVSNPNKMTDTISYSPPDNLESKYNLTQKYIKNNSMYMSDEAVKEIQMYGLTDMRTKEDYNKLASTVLPPEYSAEFNDKYLNSKYSIKWERPQGGGGFTGYLIKDGVKIQQVPAVNTDYNSQVYGDYTMKIVGKYLEDQIAEYRRKALYSNN